MVEPTAGARNRKTHHPLFFLCQNEGRGFQWSELKIVKHQVFEELNIF